jgi:hypothetical protein
MSDFEWQRFLRAHGASPSGKPRKDRIAEAAAVAGQTTASFVMPSTRRPPRRRVRRKPKRRQGRHDQGRLGHDLAVLGLDPGVASRAARDVDLEDAGQQPRPRHAVWGLAAGLGRSNWSLSVQIAISILSG